MLSQCARLLAWLRDSYAQYRMRSAILRNHLNTPLSRTMRERLCINYLSVTQIRIEASFSAWCRLQLLVFLSLCSFFYILLLLFSFNREIHRNFSSFHHRWKEINLRLWCFIRMCGVQVVIASISHENRGWCSEEDNHWWGSWDAIYWIFRQANYLLDLQFDDWDFHQAIPQSGSRLNDERIIKNMSGTNFWTRYEWHPKQSFYSSKFWEKERTGARTTLIICELNETLFEIRNIINN